MTCCKLVTDRMDSTSPSVSWASLEFSARSPATLTTKWSKLGSGRRQLPNYAEMDSIGDASLADQCVHSAYLRSEAWVFSGYSVESPLDLCKLEKQLIESQCLLVIQGNFIHVLREKVKIWNNNIKTLTNCLFLLTGVVVFLNPKCATGSFILETVVIWICFCGGFDVVNCCFFPIWKKEWFLKYVFVFELESVLLNVLKFVW